MTPEAVAAEVDAASLLGRGGAGFPAGRKWSMLRKNPVTYLVVNGDESEPATFKDHLLVERRPAPADRGRAHRRLRPAGHPGLHLPAGRVRPRPRAGAGGPQRGLRPRRGRAATSSARASRVDVVVHPGAGAYICGEETALLESLEGKRGFPRIKPPFFPAAIGLYGEPTVVNNVETMSNLPWIIDNGGAAFAALGEGRSTGTRLFALAGHVQQPGRLRARDGQDHLRDLIYAPVLGGGIPHGREPQGVHPRRRLGPVVRARPGRPAPRPGRGGRGRLHARLGLRRGHGRRTPAWCGPPGASPSSSPASRAASARRAARARAGSSGSCTASRTAPGREEDLDLLMDAVRQHLARRGLAAAADHHLRARAVHPVVDRARPSACSATSSWSTSRKGAAPMTDRPRPATEAPSRRTGRRGRPSPSTGATVTRQARARCSSPRPSGPGPTSRASATTRAWSRSACAACAWSR